MTSKKLIKVASDDRELPLTELGACCLLAGVGTELASSASSREAAWHYLPSTQAWVFVVVFVFFVFFRQEIVKDGRVEGRVEMHKHIHETGGRFREKQSGRLSVCSQQS